MSNMIEGVVAFSHLAEPEAFMGSDPKYKVTVTLDEAQASILADGGVKVKQYEGKAQRQFASKYPPKVIVDAEGEPFVGEVPWGSTIRVVFQYGKEHPAHGKGVYATHVRVLEVPEGAEGGSNEAAPSDF